MTWGPATDFGSFECEITLEKPRDTRMAISPTTGKCSNLDKKDIFYSIREQRERDGIKAEWFVHLPKYKPKTMPAPRKAPMVCARM